MWQGVAGTAGAAAYTKAVKTMATVVMKSQYGIHRDVRGSTKPVEPSLNRARKLAAYSKASLLGP
jgi:hypothetical protein